MAIDYGFDDYPDPPPRPKAPEKPAFDKVPDQLMRNTQDAALWQDCIAEYKRIMHTIDPVGIVKQTIADLDVQDDKNSKCREALLPARTLIGSMPTSSWPQARSYMTYGAFDLVSAQCAWLANRTGCEGTDGHGGGYPKNCRCRRRKRPVA